MKRNLTCTWLALLVCALFWGGVAGWALRIYFRG